jgi:hypothetical protein
MNKHFAIWREYLFYARVANPPYVIDVDVLHHMHPLLDTADINSLITITTNMAHDLITTFLSEQEEMTIVIKGQVYKKEEPTGFDQIIFTDPILSRVLWEY